VKARKKKKSDQKRKKKLDKGAFNAQPSCEEKTVLTGSGSFSKRGGESRCPRVANEGKRFKRGRDLQVRTGTRKIRKNATTCRGGGLGFGEKKETQGIEGKKRHTPGKSQDHTDGSPTRKEHGWFPGGGRLKRKKLGNQSGVV